ncbi:Hypothetical predicted protein [Pelobates cultripes]|uniref:Uncharacterized protein n=1 Tax=Pelobates cultripes TaxID=61616 RepID=A0AAD1SY12_PELCU|nr:Hypothetical predicted protein [Pelobates cultripes]
MHNSHHNIQAYTAEGNAETGAAMHGKTSSERKTCNKVSTIQRSLTSSEAIRGKTMKHRPHGRKSSYDKRRLPRTLLAHPLQGTDLVPRRTQVSGTCRPGAEEAPCSGTPHTQAEKQLCHLKELAELSLGTTI